MRRFCFTFCLAALVAPPVAVSCSSALALISAPSLAAVGTAVIHVASGAIALAVALTLLALMDDPPPRRLWIYDWRLLRRAVRGSAAST